MAFYRGAQELPAKLVHHTGTMVRFTTSQLPALPAQDERCEVALPDGRVVSGDFRMNPANPYIRGRELVGWIKSWVPWNEPIDVTLRQAGQTSRLQVLIPGQVGVLLTSPSLEQRLRALAGQRSSDRRRRDYESWERDPGLRAIALGAWGATCQVSGCAAVPTVPTHLRAALVEVHHLNHVAAGGTDSPLNICLVCANHHALIHRGGGRLVRCDGNGAGVQVNGILLDIRRDISLLW